MTRVGVRTSGRSRGGADGSFEYKTYVGTPLRPNFVSASVMAGSRDVQSALSVATFFSWNFARTDAADNATRSFTWQVRHQAAPKSTNTGRPAARSSFTRASL